MEERERLANSIGVTSASCAPGRVRGGIIDRLFPEGRGRRVIRRRSPRNGVISTWVSIVSTRHGIARPARRVLPAIEKLTVGNASQRIHPSRPPPLNLRPPHLPAPLLPAAPVPRERPLFVSPLRNCGVCRVRLLARVSTFHVGGEGSVAPAEGRGGGLRGATAGEASVRDRICEGRVGGGRGKRMSSRDAIRCATTRRAGSASRVSVPDEGHRQKSERIRKVSWSSELHLIEVGFNSEDFAAGITERFSRVVTDSRAVGCAAHRHTHRCNQVLTPR